MAFVETPRGRLHHRVVGRGPVTVLLAPDPPNTLAHLEPLVAHLDGHRVLTYEPPGFGASRAGRGFDHSLAAHAAALQDVLTATRTAQAVLVVPCILGLAAVHLAVTHPEQVIGLVLPQVPDWTHAQRWADGVDPHRLLRRPLVAPAVMGLAGERIARGWYEVAEPDAARRAALLATRQAVPRRARRFPLHHALRALSGPDPLADRVAHVPAVVLWGTADRSHAHTPPDSVRPHLRHATLHTFPAAGHFSDLADPAAVARAVAQVAAGRPDAAT